MQNKKLINVSQAVIGKQGVYSIEFHEDDHYTHVKRVNPGGSETLFPVGGSSGSSSKTYEYWENTNLGTQSILANQNTGLVNDGLGANTSSGAGVLYDGNLFDFSSLPVGSVVSITLQTSLQPTTQHSHDFTIYFNHETDNGTKQFSFVTDETRTQGRPITHTLTIPIIDEGMKNGPARLSITSTGDLTAYNNFLSISVL
jgi:hypothetical protein